MLMYTDKCRMPPYDDMKLFLTYLDDYSRKKSNVYRGICLTYDGCEYIKKAVKLKEIKELIMPYLREKEVFTDIKEDDIIIDITNMPKEKIYKIKSKYK